MCNVIEKISYHRKVSTTRECQTHSLWSQPFTFPIFSPSLSSPWYICFCSSGIIKSWTTKKTFFIIIFSFCLREFLIIKRVRRFFRRSCDIRIYVLTQLLPFLYTQSRVYAEIIWRWDLCYYFDKKKANNNKKMKTKSFYFANWMTNLNLSWLIGRKLLGDGRYFGKYARGRFFN